jgi:hypothetical protein
MPSRDPAPRRPLRRKEVGDEFWLLLVRSLRAPLFAVGRTPNMVSTKSRILYLIEINLGQFRGAPSNCLVSLSADAVCSRRRDVCYWHKADIQLSS